MERCCPKFWVGMARVRHYGWSHSHLWYMSSTMMHVRVFPSLEVFPRSVCIFLLHSDCCLQVKTWCRCQIVGDGSFLDVVPLLEASVLSHDLEEYFGSIWRCFGVFRCFELNFGDATNALLVVSSWWCLPQDGLSSATHSSTPLGAQGGCCIDNGNSVEVVVLSTWPKLVKKRHWCLVWVRPFSCHDCSVCGG
jgi:hypothetical protein